MDLNIVEILVVLMREFPEGAIKPEEYETLTKDLIGKGYSPREIETAFFWFHSRHEHRHLVPEVDVIDPDSFRVLHEIEKSVLTTEAYGYLIELNRMGIISMIDLDRIIEKAVLLGGRRVNADEIKMFVAAQLMDQEAGTINFGESYYVKTPTDKIQ